MQVPGANMPVACSVPNYAPERVRSARESEQNSRRASHVQPAWPACLERQLRFQRGLSPLEHEGTRSGHAPVSQRAGFWRVQGKRKAREAGLCAASRALRFPCAARIPRSVITFRENVALIVDQRNCRKHPLLSRGSMSSFMLGSVAMESR